MLGVSVFLFVSAASAQQVPGSAPNGPGAMTTPPAQAQQQPSAQAPNGQALSAAPAATPPTANGPVTGFTYGQGKRRPSAAAVNNNPAPRRAVAAPTGPTAMRPGFEMTEDGASRVFVELSTPVAVEEKRAASSITYVLKGARIGKWNNTNSLVTVHFNTPVSKAKLSPSGRDLHLLVELRNGATPTWRMANEQNAARLVIDFPKGEYLQNGEPIAAAAAALPAKGSKPGKPMIAAPTPPPAPTPPAPPAAPAVPAAPASPATPPAPQAPARTSGGASTDFGN